MSAEEDTYRQVVPQLALLHLQRRLRQVKLGNGESWDGVVEVEAKRDQPDVDIYTDGERKSLDTVVSAAFSSVLHVVRTECLCCVLLPFELICSFSLQSPKKF